MIMFIYFVIPIDKFCDSRDTEYLFLQEGKKFHPNYADKG